MKERWPEIKALFGEVFEMDPVERARVLGGPEVDPWVRSQVEQLLAASGQGGGLLDRPAVLQLAGPDAHPSSVDLVGRMIGPYRVVREIGRGGMGTVYEGMRPDAEFEQRVAIKTLRIGLEVPELLSQFRRERQILAGLQHPNIAALLDGGVTAEGVPFIVLEYVDGAPIDRYCDTHRLDLRARLDLFRQVLDAVQYAHRQLVIHRDLKPSNILVTNDGHVKLLDFGIARLIRADGREVTQPGTAAITPAYASPEQLRGERASTATDVYSLALVLYRLLTGKSPLTEALVSPVEVLAALATDSLPPPSADPTLGAATAMGFGSVERLRRLLTGEIDAVILKALRLEPERRYSSVEALGEDLQRYLRGLPVTAQPDTAWYRLSKFVRRRRGLVGGLAAATVALVAGSSVAWWQARRAETQARRATGVATFLQEIIGAAAPTSAFARAPRLGPMATVAELVDSAAVRIDGAAHDQPEVGVALHHLFGLAYQSQERPAEAAAQFAAMRRSAATTYRSPSLVDAVAGAGMAAEAARNQDWAAADSLLQFTEQTLNALDQKHPDQYGELLQQFGAQSRTPWPETLAGLKADLHLALSTVRIGQERPKDALTEARTAAGFAAHTTPELRARAGATVGALLLSTEGDRRAGQSMLWQSLRTVDSMADPDVREKALILSALVMTGTATGPSGDSLGREAFRIYERSTGPQSLAVAEQLWLRGATARVRGDTGLQRVSLERAIRIVGTHPATPPYLRQTVTMEFARTQWLGGRIDSAVALARGVYQERLRAAPGGFPAAEAGQLLGVLLHIRGRQNPGQRDADYLAAEAVLRPADSTMRLLLPASHYWPRTTAESLVRLYRDWGRAADARRYLALLPDSVQKKLGPTPP